MHLFVIPFISTIGRRSTQYCGTVPPYRDPDSDSDSDFVPAPAPGVLHLTVQYILLDDATGATVSLSGV